VTSRRALLEGIAAAGGINAAVAALGALGGMAPTPAQAAAPALPRGGKPVLVVGGGIAGLVVALELKRAGWPVKLLEASDRPGGRCLTLRAGDTVREADATTQKVEWDSAAHLYVNPGPARIPHHHRGILGYCKQLGVALEPLVNENRAALAEAPDGPVPLRQVQAGLRGVVAELAAKGLERGTLEAPLSEADLEALRAMLRGFGALDRELRWRGGSRGGWAERPGVEAGKPALPLDARALLDPVLWRGATFAEGIDYAATMLQPVGGIDRITRALAKALGDSLVLNAEVTSLRRQSGGARVAWRDRRRGGAVHVETPARVVLALPAPVLAALDTDLSAPRREALRGLAYASAGKLAFQCERRFWEDDHAIYGGISFSARDVNQLWYPSHGFHARKGVLLGAYIWGGAAGERFAGRTPAERSAAAVADGAALHPGYAGQVAKPVSVAWANMPLARGAWVEWTAAQRAQSYDMLRAAEEPYHFAGEHLSHQTAWMEGAVISAWATLEGLARV
jgi:monoamine oxidase